MKLNIQLFAEETDVSIKFTNKITNANKLEQYAESLSKIRNILAGMDEGTITAISKSSNEISNIDKGTGQLEKNTSKLAKNFNTMFNFTMIRTFARAMGNLTKTIASLATKSSDYAENINLYQTSFSGATKEADRFINKLTEMYGLDESWLTKTVGIFKQLSNAMNLSVETGTKLSTLLTQMSIDVSSLYNIDVDRAASTLQSALAGLIISLARQLKKYLSKCKNTLKALILSVTIQSM